MENNRARNFFVVGLILATALLLYVVLPVFAAIFWGVVLAVVFGPLHQKIENALSHKKNVSAFASTLSCILCIVTPVLFVLALAAGQLAELVSNTFSSDVSVKKMTEDLITKISFLPEIMGKFDISQDQIVDYAKSAGKSVSQSLAGGSFLVGKNILTTILQFGLMSYLLFFLFRDGKDMISYLLKILPLNKNLSHQLLDKSNAAIRATIRGNFLVAAIQGTVGGIIFYFLGVSSPILLAVLMMLATLIPVAGSALVWLPVALYLLLNGDYTKGIVVVASGVLIIGLIDNVLRPIFVGGETKLPDYIVLFTTVGGISLFGFEGFVIGPLAASIAYVFWNVLREQEAVEI